MYRNIRSTTFIAYRTDVTKRTRSPGGSMPSWPFTLYPRHSTARIKICTPRRSFTQLSVLHVIHNSVVYVHVRFCEGGSKPQRYRGMHCNLLCAGRSRVNKRCGPRMEECGKSPRSRHIHTYVVARRTRTTSDEKRDIRPSWNDPAIYRIIEEFHRDSRVPFLLDFTKTPARHPGLLIRSP